MTDDERIAEIAYRAGQACITLEDLLWLLNGYRRDHPDAERFRHCERMAEPSDVHNAEPWWVLTVRGPTFAEAVDAAMEQATTD